MVRAISGVQDVIWRLSLILGAMSLAPASAAGAEVTEQLFQVTYTHGGKDYVADDGIVPLLPGNACYYWYLRLAETDAPVALVERFTLPEALSSWGTTGTMPDDPTRIEEDGKVAVTTLEATSDSEGWVSHGWCVAEGDPPGLHRIDVSAGGAGLASFEFDVVTPEDYRFPVPLPPDPDARSTNNSW